MDPNVPHGIALLRRLIYRYKGSSIVGAELGVFSGQLSKYILREYPKMYLYMIDMWKGVESGCSYVTSGDIIAQCTTKEMMTCMKHARDVTEFASDRRDIIWKESADASEEFSDGSLDFVFIDADHHKDAVIRDLGLWYSKVKSGGLFSGHDFFIEKHSTWDVRGALSEFLPSVGLSISDVGLGSGGTWFVDLPNEDGSTRPKWGVYAVGEGNSVKVNCLVENS